MVNCTNTLGSYVCRCATGFNGTGFECADIDECVSGNNCSTLANCTNTLGSYVCTCATGLNGTGFKCADIDECSKGDICSQFATCHNTPGSFNCTCNSGYTGNGSVCTDIDECVNENICTISQVCLNAPGSYRCLAVNSTGESDACLMDNGGCDLHVTCTNVNGTKNCGKCPLGFNGTGNSACIPLCGDGKCNATIGETCTSCPKDCTEEFCGVCGDGTCDSNETCSTCFEDCRNECDFSCDSCSVNGECILGTCVCSGQYTGPTCEDLPSTIEVTASSPSPFVAFKSLSSPQSALPQNTSFQISFQNISEITEDGSNVASFDLTNISFPFSHFPPTNSSKNQMWIFTSTLDNKANITITVHQFGDPSTNYTFYNETKTYSQNTVKVNLKIANWPFKSFYNTLTVVMKNEVMEGGGEQENDGVCVAYQPIGPTLAWIKLTINGVSLYTQFDPVTYVDGRKRNITFSSTNGFSIVATLPHFWDFAELDPNYAILFNFDDNTQICVSTNGTINREINKTIVIASVVPVMVVIFFAAILYWLYLRRREGKLKKRIRSLPLTPLTNVPTYDQTPRM